MTEARARIPEEPRVALRPKTAAGGVCRALRPERVAERKQLVALSAGTTDAARSLHEGHDVGTVRIFARLDRQHTVSFGFDADDGATVCRATHSLAVNGHVAGVELGFDQDERPFLGGPPALDDDERRLQIVVVAHVRNAWQ
jgi:hypothetical protein